MAISRVTIVFANAALLISLSLNSAQAQCTFDWCPGDGYPGVDGYIGTATTWTPPGSGGSPLLIVAGGFTQVLGIPIQGYIASWDGLEWHQLGTGLSGSVSCVTVYNGELIASGNFAFAGGAYVRNIARWNGSTWQAMGGGLSNAASAMIVFNNELVVGGAITQAGSTPVNYIARWNGTTWLPLGSGLNARVSSLCTFNGDLIAGGSFTGSGNITMKGVARWTGSSWESLANGIGRSVSSLAVFGNKLIAGGTSGVFTNPIAGFLGQWDGSSWTTLGSGLDGEALTLHVFQDQLIVAGYFDRAGGNYANDIARWNGTSWAALGTGLGSVSAFPYGLTIFNGELICGGGFLSAGGIAVNGLARWDGQRWRPFGNGIGGNQNSHSIRCLLSYSGEVVAGGLFPSAGGHLVGSIAKWNGHDWNPLGTGIQNSLVRALCEYKGRLVAGGSFNSIGGVTASKIASWNGSTWAPIGTGVGLASIEGVRAVTVYHDQLIAVGEFERYLAIPPYAAKWNGSNWTSLGAGVNDRCFAAVVFNDELVVAGIFSTAGGTPANRIARWNGSLWQPLGTGFNIESAYSLVVYNGELIAGGGFTSAGGVPANRIARWNGSSWKPLGTGLNGSVNALSVYNESLIACGGFTTAGSTPANQIARWDGNNWSPLGAGLPSNVYPGGIPYALTVFRDDLIAGGNFARAGSYPSFAFARYGPTGPAPTITQHPSSPSICQGSAISLRSTATGNGALSYQWRKNGEPLTDDEDTFGTQSPTLAFAHAAASDAGTYDCLVKLNNCTQATSNTATLSVFPTNTADGNLDGHTDARDIAVFVDALVNFAPVSAPLCAYDLTGEGIVNPDDIPPFVTRLLSE